MQDHDAELRALKDKARTLKARRGFHRPAPRIVASAMDGDATAIGGATLPLRAAFFDRDAGGE